MDNVLAIGSEQVNLNIKLLIDWDGGCSEKIVMFTV